LNRLGDIGIALFGGHSALFVQKDVALGIEPVLARLCLGGVQRRGLLHVVEHQDRLARFHRLALLHQDLHDPSIRLRPEGDIRGGAQATDDVNRGIEFSAANRLDLHRGGLTLGLLGATAQQEQQRQGCQQAPHDGDSEIRKLGRSRRFGPRMMGIETHPARRERSLQPSR